MTASLASSPGRRELGAAGGGLAARGSQEGHGRATSVDSSEFRDRIKCPPAGELSAAGRVREPRGSRPHCLPAPQVTPRAVPGGKGQPGAPVAPVTSIGNGGGGPGTPGRSFLLGRHMSVNLRRSGQPGGGEAGQADPRNPNPLQQTPWAIPAGLCSARTSVSSSRGLDLSRWGCFCGWLQSPGPRGPVSATPRPAGQGDVPSRPAAQASLVPQRLEGAWVRGFLGRPRQDRAVSVWILGGVPGLSEEQGGRARPAAGVCTLPDAN